jgi:cobyrinic acid a,c-diamide synthase
VPGGEQVDSDALIAQMAVAVSARFDVDGIVAVARERGSPRQLRVTAAHEGDHEGAPSRMRPVIDAASADINSGARVGHADAAVESDRSREASPAHGARATADVVFASADGKRGAEVSRAGGARPVIAVARDEAFCFYYPENLELLVEAGANVEFFSPLRGERPSRAAVGVYLGGGYPELHGPALASNTDLWRALQDLHAQNRPIFAECGGFMVLTDGLTDSNGHTWPMAGLLPGVTRMTGKLAALGYRQVTALRPNLLAEPGKSLRGHEFRYSTWVCEAGTIGEAAAWDVKGTRGRVPEDAVGYVSGNLLASYLHIHFGQNRELARRFVARL